MKRKDASRLDAMAGHLDAVAEAAPEPRRSGKDAAAPKKARTPRQNSKKAQVIKMLEAAEGATLADIMALTNWLPHSVRGFISGSLVKKMGLKVESFKREDGTRAYRLPPK